MDRLSLQLADSNITVIHRNNLIEISLLDVVSLYNKEKGIDDLEEAYLEFVEWGYSTAPGEFEELKHLQIGPYKVIRLQVQEDFEDLVEINREE